MIPEKVKYTVIIVTAIAGWYKDLIMDILVAVDVSFLFTSPWDFKSQMVLVLWVTIFLSQTIVGLRVLLYGPRRVLGPQFEEMSLIPTILLRLLFLLLSPLAPGLLLYLVTRHSRKVRRREKELLDLFKIRHDQTVSEVLVRQQLACFKAREEELKEREKLQRILVMSYRWV